VTLRARNRMSAKSLSLFDSEPAAATRLPRRRPAAKTTGPHPLAGTLPALDLPDDRLVYRLTYEARPWTLNIERRENRWRRGEKVAEWRTAFTTLAREERMRPAGSIAVTVWPELRHGGSVPDTAACIGAAKAGIDGIKDAGVLPDDGPEYVRRLTFMAPIITGRDALTLDVEVLS
jgi:hypothetical protein